MSTPATAALSDAASATGSGNGTSGTGGVGTGSSGAQTGTGTAGTSGAAVTGFWSTWDKPEQKETRDWVANKAYADPFVLAKSARDWETQAATLRAGKGYPTQTRNADGTFGPPDPNAVKAWNALVGVPETPDKYDIPLPENNPYPMFKNFMAEELHKAGVPAAMAPILAKGYEAAVGKMETQLREAENAQSAEALVQLQGSWGAQYQERMALAARGKEWLAKEAGGLDDLQLRTLESVLTTPKFLTAMWKIGAGNREASFAGGDHPPGFTGGAAEAQARLDQIMADRSAGKISDFQWRGGVEKEVVELANKIANGMAPPNG